MGIHPVSFNVFVNQGMRLDVVRKLAQLVFHGQFAENEQVGHLREI